MSNNKVPLLERTCCIANWLCTIGNLERTPLGKVHKDKLKLFEKSFSSSAQLRVRRVLYVAPGYECSDTNIGKGYSMSRACISDTSFIFYLSSQCDTKPQVFILGMESLSLINISLNNFFGSKQKRTQVWIFSAFFPISWYFLILGRNSRLHNESQTHPNKLMSTCLIQPHSFLNTNLQN